MFREIFLKFHEISQNSNKFCQNFVFCQICTMLFCSNPTYVGVEEEEGGGGVGGASAYLLAPPSR